MNVTCNGTRLKRDGVKSLAYTANVYTDIDGFACGHRRGCFAESVHQYLTKELRLTIAPALNDMHGKTGNLQARAARHG